MSGTATTTFSDSCYGVSSSGAILTRCRRSAPRHGVVIANDLPEDALVYGHTAGETNTVAALVDSLALPAHYDGRMETLDEWLSWFDEGDLAQYPALAVYGAWLRALTGRPEDAERWLALTDGATR